MSTSPLNKAAVPALTEALQLTMQLARFIRATDAQSWKTLLEQILELAQDETDGEIRAWVIAAGAPSFQSVWDNEEDACFDDM